MAAHNCSRTPGEYAPATGPRPKRLYLGLLFFAFALSLSAACILAWALQPRLEAAHPMLNQAVLMLVLAYTGAFAILFGSVCASLYLRKPLRLAEMALGAMEQAYPVVSLVAVRLGIADYQVRRSLTEVSSALAGNRLQAMTSGRIACIAASCLDAAATARVSSMAAEYDCDFYQPRGVMDARNWLLVQRPVALIAVACDPDFVARITELEYRLPMTIVRARLSSDPEQSFDSREVLEALEAFRERFDEPVEASEAVTARHRR